MKKAPPMIKNQKGQSVMEYIIISCLVGIFCLGAMKKYGQRLQDRIEFMEGRIHNYLKLK